MTPRQLGCVVVLLAACSHTPHVQLEDGWEVAPPSPVSAEVARELSRFQGSTFETRRGKDMCGVFWTRGIRGCTAEWGITRHVPIKTIDGEVLDLGGILDGRTRASCGETAHVCGLALECHCLPEPDGGP